MAVKNLLLALLLMHLAVQIFAACPHDCNGHGSCSHNVCRCSQGWSGSDCSEADEPLVSGAVIPGSLSTFSWHYYHINVPYGSQSLNVTVRQTSVYGDVDVYLQRESKPTDRNYFVRDDQNNEVTEIGIMNPLPGKWYIGLYGYWHVDYTIKAEVILDCALDCGAHGQCSGHSCICDTPYIGDSCETYDRQMVSGAEYQDQVQTGEWKFFHILVPETKTLLVTLVDTEPRTGDTDLYLKFGSYPSWFDFNYFNGSIARESTLFVEMPEAGTWYIGVYGFRGNGFSIVAEVNTRVTCPNQCSGAAHGTCSNTRCSCQSDFSGPACERKKSPLALNTPVSGFVSSTNWNYYRFSVLTENNVKLQVTQTSGGDCDMFVRSGQDPTRQEFDFADLSFSSEFSILIEEPSGVEWFVGVYGWIDCAYNIEMTIPVACSCVGQNGYCEANSDVCVCNSGWVGVGCETRSDVIQIGDVLTHQTVHQGQWVYYRINAESRLLTVSLRETSTIGLVWLFGSQKKNPTLDKHDEVDMMTNTDFHEVHFVYKSAKSRSFYIGVYGSPYITRDVAVSYSLTAWAPPF